ncbi:MAG: hypothetical protein E7402_02745 [Ruminococcaceae bacterium]|nr:hypothetical protein [Oscillospiraceae bacterium]
MKSKVLLGAMSLLVVAGSLVGCGTNMDQEAKPSEQQQQQQTTAPTTASTKAPEAESDKTETGVGDKIVSDVKDAGKAASDAVKAQ